MKLFAFLFLLLPFVSYAGDNTLDDAFRVKSIKGQQAVVEGKSKDLKSGDILYFGRSPFKFTVDSVSGGLITINLPPSHDLQVGNTLVRNPTDSILKSIDTEKKLKTALEE